MITHIPGARRGSAGASGPVLRRAATHRAPRATPRRVPRRRPRRAFCAEGRREETAATRRRVSDGTSQQWKSSSSNEAATPVWLWPDGTIDQNSPAAATMCHNTHHENSVIAQALSIPDGGAPGVAAATG